MAEAVAGVKPRKLDFFQYENARGFDDSGRELNAQIAESGVNSFDHNRHFVFRLPRDNKQIGGLLNRKPAIFFFKVFAKPCQLEDTLQIRVKEYRKIQAEIYKEFYDNQRTGFWMFFIFGVAFFQLLYIGSLAWSRRKPEYFYYWAFVFVAIIYLLISRGYELGNVLDFKFLIPSSVLVYLALLNFFYCRFVRYYLDSKNSDSFTDSQYRMAEWFLLAGTLVNALIYVFTLDFEYTFSFFVPFSNAIIIIDVYLILLLFRQKSKLVRYLILGPVAFVIPTGFRVIYTYLQSLGIFSESLDIDTYGSIFGTFFDAICLNLGLNYKYHFELKEKQKIVAQMRQQIAADLHDDIGSSLSSIFLLSEMVKLFLNGSNGEVQVLLDKIQANARITIENTKTIIWAMDTRYDKVSDLVDLMRDFGNTLSDVQKFEWQLEHLPHFENRKLTPDLKKNLYLIFKESINNAVKYAQSEVIEINLNVENDIVYCHIKDFGKGFDINIITHGNGLKNIENRAKFLNGTATIFSEYNKGTTISVEVPLVK